MGLFVMFTKLTDEGRKTIKQNPDRILEVNKEVESMGARVMEQYAVLGEYDFINILEAPSNEVVQRVAMELGSRGTIQTLTVPAMKLEDFIESIKVGRK